MIIAVSYKDGEIYEHFGHAEYFAIYTTNNDQTEITGKKVIEVKETGHQAVADLMDENGVDVVIVGNIGCKDKTDYTVIGDSANLASRLEGLTKQYGARIIISQAVRNELDEGYNLLQVDTVKVKGKKLGVQVYRSDLKPLDKEYVQLYEKGLSLYINGAFNLAAPYFEQALEIFPVDRAATLMKNRCIEFSAVPPENWDGAISLTSK